MRSSLALLAAATALGAAPRARAEPAEPAKPEPAKAPALALSVTERGTGRPWMLSIANVGTEPTELVADPRLLWFEVTVPGKKKPETCRLPADLFPSRIDRRTVVSLSPGEGVEQTFDPRLYCFAAGGQWQLVPGAVIAPHFGWPEKKRVTWKGGKRVEEIPKQSPPFVATTLAAKAAHKDSVPDGQKQLETTPFALRSEYAEWARTRIDADQTPEEAPLVIKTVQGSDASAERTATIQITLTNRGKQPHHVYFRRELVSYEVMRPDGLVTCDAQPDLRAPDRQAFSRLGPGGSISVVSRLVEMCPAGTFGQPGLYLVHARFDATDAGEEYGLDAYVGRAVSRGPATVRIRTGEQPFLHKREMVKVKAPGKAEPD